MILYTAPDRQEKDYAQVFPGDHSNLSEALGRALAKYVFYKLRQVPPDDAPLLLFPPMEDEVRRVFAAVTYNAGMEQYSARGELEHLGSCVSWSMISKEKQTITRQLIGSQRKRRSLSAS